MTERKVFLMLALCLLRCSAGGQNLAGGLTAFSAGFFSSIEDIVGNDAKYRLSVFHLQRPGFSYGQYLGPKSQTWVNKWERGAVGVERFPLSSTVFVGLTDVWHGSRTARNFSFFFTVGVDLPGFSIFSPSWGQFKRPHRREIWKKAAIGLLVRSVAYSAGWYAGNLVFCPNCL